MVRKYLRYAGQLVALALLASQLGHPGGPPAVPRWLGVIGATPATAGVFARAGVTQVVEGLSWSSVMPRPGVVDTAYVQKMIRFSESLRAEKVEVVLDPGIQYAPGWVLDLPGQARFVDQYGDVWHGPTGADVADGVFNPVVRAAVLDYLSLIARYFPPDTFAAIRVGGLLDGELRLPGAHEYGHDNALWCFGPSARRGWPVTGWSPATASTGDDRIMLDWYLHRVDEYEQTLLSAAARLFPDSDLQVLFPGWGIRPGQAEEAIADHLDGRSAGERGDSIAGALDVAAQVPILARFGTRAVAYTTWLDAPDNGPGAQDEAPIYYLRSLTRGTQTGLAGENTGRQTAAALAVSVSRAVELHLRGVMWMSAPRVLADRGVTLDMLTSAARLLN